ncbi:MAG: hypothetical protein U0930_05105 [Pirellulales bacterium]
MVRIRSSVDTKSAIWLTAIAKGLVRDDNGNMVAEEANDLELGEPTSSDFDVSKVSWPWECEFGDYDSYPIEDEHGDIVDSGGLIEDCSKNSEPFCQYCPRKQQYDAT